MNKFLKLFFVSFIIILTCSGCSSVFLKIKNTTIENETRISEIPINERVILTKLNSNPDGGGIFNSAKSATINGYTILFSEQEDSIFIIKNKKVISEISEGGETILIFKNLFEAPSIGTERVIISKKYISYSGEKYTFEDFGFDGIDVQYEFSNAGNPQSFINGKKCEKTIVAGVACCTDNNGNLQGYRFTPTNGWEISKNPRTMENCQKAP